MKLWGTTAVATVASMAALAPAANAATVCNEAENSPHGGYVVSGGIVDPNPPAHLRDVTQMRVGNDRAAGLDHAADRSPALRQCVPDDVGPTGTDGDGDGDTGGEDPTIGIT